MIYLNFQPIYKSSLREWKIKTWKRRVKKQLKMFEEKLRDDLVVQEETSFNWVKYFKG